MTNKTYVYEGKEHVLTGRTAEKTLRSKKTKKLHEIHPADVDASNTEYNQWVSIEDLYEVAP